MWHAGRPAADQCEGCTWVTTQVGELSYLHSRDVTLVDRHGLLRLPRRPITRGRLAGAGLLLGGVALVQLA